MDVVVDVDAVLGCLCLVLIDRRITAAAAVIDTGDSAASDEDSTRLLYCLRGGGVGVLLRLLEAHAVHLRLLGQLHLGVAAQVEIESKV